MKCETLSMVTTVSSNYTHRNYHKVYTRYGSHEFSKKSSYARSVHSCKIPITRMYNS